MAAHSIDDMPEVTQLLSDGGELGPPTHPLSLIGLLAGHHAPEPTLSRASPLW